MNTAILRQYKISIYNKTIITNDYGEYKEELVYKCSTRAGLINQGQNHNFTNDENQYPMTKTLLVRHYIEINAGDVVVLDGKKYEVLGVDDNLYFHNKSVYITEINE